MSTATISQLERLDDMSLIELRVLYRTAFGEPTYSRHRGWLVRRIAWKLQAQEAGGLSDRAMAKAASMSQHVVQRVRRRGPARPLSPPAQRTKEIALPSQRPEALVPGTVLRRDFKGRTILATVLDDGFLCEGTVYQSLSSLARAVTGTRWNGHAFFGLRRRGRAA